MSEQNQCDCCERGFPHKLHPIGVGLGDGETKKTKHYCQECIAGLSLGLARFEKKAATVSNDKPIIDPWEDRASGLRCATCWVFCPKATDRPVDPVKGPIGRCRDGSPSMRGYPVVFAMDWCGQHKLDETKI